MAMLIDPARQLAENTINQYRDSKIEVLANQLDSIQKLLDSIEKDNPQSTLESVQKQEEASQDYKFIRQACEDMGIAKVVEQFRDAKAYLIAIGL